MASPALPSTTAPEHVQLRAAAMSSLFADEDRGWTRLTANPQRDLSPLKHDRMLEIAYYLYEQNPMGKWLLETTRDFVLGEGVTVTSPDQDVQAVLDAFWHDPLNNLDVTLPQKVLELGMFGEQCWPVFVNQVSGLVRLGVVDPAVIADVTHDPDNAAAPIGLRLRARGGRRGKRLRILYPVPDSALFAAEAQRLRANDFTDGDCFWFTVNKVSTATRGRSDLFSVGDWIDGYEQFLFNTVDRTGYLNAFVWDILLQGATDDEIAAWQAKNDPPKPGSNFAHNESVTMTPLTPNLQGADTSEHARTFRNHILGGSGMPEHWYGGGGDVNLATAEAMGAPTFKKLTARQRLTKSILDTVLTYQLSQATRLTARQREARDFTVTMPQMVTEDLTRISAALQQLVMAVAVAEDRQWITRETAQQLFAALGNRTGVEIPLDPVAVADAARVTPEYRGNGTPIGRR